MRTFVYKSLNKADTYVYLSARDDFARLPEPLRARLGRLQFVIEVALTAEPGRVGEDADSSSADTVARVARHPPATLGGLPVATVRENLVLRGFHLHVPPASGIDPMSDDWGTDA